MGTSGAYGGTPGWNDTRTATDDWLDSITNPSGADDGEDSPENGEESQPAMPVEVPLIPSENPLLIGLLRRVARHLSRALQPAGTGGGGGGDGGTGGGRGGNARRRAAVSGGVTIAAIYGLRNGDATSVGDAGLILADLISLPPFEQARRIVDAVSRTSALVEEAELREVNANFVCWEIQQDSYPSPVELVKQWVIEYVYRAWLTEAGDRLRDGSRDGNSIHALEQEVRVTLEARVSGIELPFDGMRASHFEAAIQTLLGMLTRIFR